MENMHIFLGMAVANNNSSSRSSFNPTPQLHVEQLAQQGWQGWQSECSPLPQPGKGVGAVSPCLGRGDGVRPIGLDSMAGGGGGPQHSAAALGWQSYNIKLILLWFHGTKDCLANWPNTFGVSFAISIIVYTKLYSMKNCKSKKFF